MKICVFASSKEKIDERYKEDAFSIGEQLALHGHQLVYGGGKYGLMGAVAAGFHQGNAKITAIIPKQLNRAEIVNPINDEVIITENVSSRIEKMIECADLLLVLPGGIGTLDELFSTISKKSLQEIDKEIVIYNQFGIYDLLKEQLQYLVQTGFVAQQALTLFEICDDYKQLLEIIENKCK